MEAASKQSSAGAKNDQRKRTQGDTLDTQPGIASFFLKKPKPAGDAAVWSLPPVLAPDGAPYAPHPVRVSDLSLLRDGEALLCASKKDVEHAVYEALKAALTSELTSEHYVKKHGFFEAHKNCSKCSLTHYVHVLAVQFGVFPVVEPYLRRCLMAVKGSPDHRLKTLSGTCNFLLRGSPSKSTPPLLTAIAVNSALAGVALSRGNMEAVLADDAVWDTLGDRTTADLLVNFVDALPDLPLLERVAAYERAAFGRRVHRAAGSTSDRHRATLLLLVRGEPVPGNLLPAALRTYPGLFGSLGLAVDLRWDMTRAGQGLGMRLLTLFGDNGSPHDALISMAGGGGGGFNPDRYEGSLDLVDAIFDLNINSTLGTLDMPSRGVDDLLILIRCSPSPVKLIAFLRQVVAGLWAATRLGVPTARISFVISIAERNSALIDRPAVLVRGNGMVLSTLGLHLASWRGAGKGVFLNEISRAASSSAASYLDLFGNLLSAGTQIFTTETAACGVVVNHQILTALAFQAAGAAAEVKHRGHRCHNFDFVSPWFAIVKQVAVDCGIAVDAYLLSEEDSSQLTGAAINLRSSCGAPAASQGDIVQAAMQREPALKPLLGTLTEHSFANASACKTPIWDRFIAPPGGVALFAAADRVAVDGPGVAWLRRQDAKIWVAGIGLINVHDRFAAALLRLPFEMRKEWGRQRNFYR